MQILIVDDDIATVDVIRDNMDWEKLNIDQVHCAYNIDTAKKIICDNAIDIIVSDIEMPRGSGLELLEWYRDKKYTGEFLLLTCHESFDYATNAIKLHASEYLLKPFDVNIMEAALKKIGKAVMDRQSENGGRSHTSDINRRQAVTLFFKDMFSGHIAKSRDEIKDEIRRRKLELDADGEYYLVVSKITGMEKDREKMNQSLLFFIAENIHSEILCGNPDMTHVYGVEYSDSFYLAAVCNMDSYDTAANQCAALIAEFKKIFSSEIMCCIGNPTKMWNFYEEYRNCIELIDLNVMSQGSYFYQKDGVREDSGNKMILDCSVLEEFLNNKKKMEFLSYLKEKLNDKVFDKTLNSQMLKQMQQEILQAVYTYLVKRGIQTSGLFTDNNLMQLGEKAGQSQINTIKWANFLIERMFLYEEEALKKYSLSDKINQYVQEHFSEDINRNTIARQFFIAPEYLSKTYKKQTGKSLTDYIAEYRIEQAKLLLDKGERVSEVANAVGFDNFTYFSTTFKKYTGTTPNQYRKK